MPDTKCRGSDSGKGRPSSPGQGNRLRLVSGGLLIVLLILAACDGGQTATEKPVQPSTLIPTTPPTALSPTSAPTTSTPSVPLAAIVNGRTILLADYERRLAQYRQPLLDQGLDPDTEEGQARLAEVEQQVLDTLIDYVLIEQGSADLGVSITDVDVEAQMAADIEVGGGQAAFDEWLQSTGQTPEDYKQMLRESLLTQRTMDAITVDVPQAAEQVHARHIVVDSQETADQILAQLQSGGDFAALAREKSLDLATKDNGGDLGWFPRGLVAPELENVAFALQPGEISNPVQFGEGYHFIQVMEREQARALSPEIQFQLKLSRFENWLAEQRAAAAIERFVGE
jgi:parvulin-like peptidyl-prolyl isomerase